MLSLREYQRKAVQSVFDYLAENPGKNPCLVLPTGSGKSVCVAAFVMACLEWWPDSRVLVVTHQKELVEQDAKALHPHDADAGALGDEGAVADHVQLFPVKVPVAAGA